MTQKAIKNFTVETFYKPPKNNYHANKTDVCHIGDIWSLDTVHLKDYGLQNSRGYRYVLVVIDNFSEFRRTVPLKIKKAQTRANSI